MRYRTTPALLVFLFLLILPIQAQDKPDPTGTWKWTTEWNGNTREQTLTLKLEGNKLTGYMLGRDNQQRAIEDASYKDGLISFKLTRERNGNRFVSVYTGQITGDTIKGKIEFTMGGENRTRDWTATRAKGASV